MAHPVTQQDTQPPAETLDAITPDQRALLQSIADNPRTLHDVRLAIFAALTPAGEVNDRLREAVRGVADDYQTSEVHHPHHVLIPIEKFEQLRAAAEALEASHD